MNEIISEIKEYVKELKIPGINQGLRMKIEEAYKLNQPYEELLRDIFMEAYDMRMENGRKNRIRNARFPYKKYLACNKGYKVFFTTAASLINELKETKSDKKLYTFEKRFEKYDLIILDELGYISFDKEGSELLFTFLSLRAERKSTIITTNLSFDRWNEIFNDAVLTAALIDRMTHKSYVLNMNGESYRIKETREWLEKSN